MKIAQHRESLPSEQKERSETRPGTVEQTERLTTERQEKEKCEMDMKSRSAISRSRLLRTKRARLALPIAAGFVLAIYAAIPAPAAQVHRPANASTVNIVVNAPFSGVAAEIGQTSFLPGAKTGAWEVNHHGGVLGRQMNVILADDQDDPADGVAAINKSLAADNPSAIIGPSSDTAAAVVPVINRSRVVDWCLCGTTQLDHMTFPYIYRPSPSDALLGSAMGLWAHKSGYTRAAFVFSSNIGSQTLVPLSIKTFQLQGGKAVLNIKVKAAQPDYRSEALQVLNSHPQVIVGELEEQTVATFMSNLKQLNHGKLIPWIESDLGASPEFHQVVSKVIGAADESKYVRGIAVEGPKTSVAYKEFRRVLKAVYPKTQQQQELVTNGYDATIITALAMTEAKSTVPAVWRSKIFSLTNGKGQIAHTYAGAVALIRHGKHPHYVGASGAITFNKYHNSAGNFWVIQYTPGGVFTQIGTMTPHELAPFLKYSP
jgi:ABC-type branched-subunit amino acid transport system substrate-binding protein